MQKHLFLTPHRLPHVIIGLWVQDEAEKKKMTVTVLAEIKIIVQSAALTWEKTQLPVLPTVSTGDVLQCLCSSNCYLCPLRTNKTKAKKSQYLSGNQLWWNEEDLKSLVNVTKTGMTVSVSATLTRVLAFCGHYKQTVLASCSHPTAPLPRQSISYPGTLSVSSSLSLMR